MERSHLSPPNAKVIETTVYHATIDESLRTVFFIDHVMLQVVLKPEATPSLWKEKAWKVGTEQFVEEFYRRDSEQITKDINHDIGSVPPLRVTLYSLPASVVLVLSIHHALYDGVCLPLIISDVESAYSGSHMLPLASLKNILTRISSHDEISAKRFWQSYFSGFNKPTSPFSDDWQEASAKSSGLTRRFRSSLSSVKAVAAKQQVTLQTLLSYAFAKMVAARLYQSRDVCFGVRFDFCSFGSPLMFDSGHPFRAFAPRGTYRVCYLPDHLPASGSSQPPG